MIGAKDIAGVLDGVRRKRPRIHCLMNTVAQKLVADGLSVVGAIPSMTSTRTEVADFARSADALLVNLGTLHDEQREAIGTALDVIRERHRPAVLDPVFCDVSPPRLAFAHALLKNGVTTVRGNGGELAALGAAGGLLTVETGASDLLRHGDKAIRVFNGHPWLALVSGTGCLSGALIAAFQSVEPDALLAATAAIAVLTVSAEIAADEAHGPGSFAPALLDALHAIDAAALAARLRIDHA